MLVSLALILMFGYLLSNLFTRLKLPGFIGMVVAGILMGGSFFNLLDDKILLISSDIRQIALIIILTRAGLVLNLEDLRKIGKPAFFMSFLPATFEIIGCMIVCPLLLGISVIESALIGCVLAAVSPAVVVPRMIKCIHEGYGQERKVPQLILAGSSLDDVIVIALFTVVVAFVDSGSVNLTNLFLVPISILNGVLCGVVIGYMFQWLVKRIHIRDSKKVLIVLAISFLVVGYEKQISTWIPFSSYIAIMSMSLSMNMFYPALAKRISVKYKQLWTVGELFLFVLVGVSVDMQFALQAGGIAFVVVMGGLSFRMMGVFVSLLSSTLTRKEKIFCSFAYLPKATVQAAIGSVPLSMGLACGELVLTCAVLSILISAPLGSILIDNYSKTLLSKEV